MSFSVGKHIFSLAPNASSNEPSNDTSIPVHSKFEASALPFPEHKLLSVGIGHRVLRCNKGWLAAVLGFLVAGLWEGVRGIIEK